jgi:uncharacterized protein (DUF2336 family)
MFGFFKKSVGKSSKSSKPNKGKKRSARYQKERKIAEGPDAKKRMVLAKSTDTHQEILYYLAEHDPDYKVRMAVAKNKSTPLQASTVLDKDVNENVRMALAYRLIDLLPELTENRHSQLYAFTVQSLGILALDEVLKIRKALSSTLKDHAHAPPNVVSKLAHDLEQDVSEPVLRFCIALTDDELIDILKSHPASWAVQAIAQRKTVSKRVSKGVIDRNDSKASKMLIENEGADITEELLMEIIEKARNYPEWHKPVATRNNLPVGVAKALAAFADDSVRDILNGRPDFDKKSIEEISEIFVRRMEFASSQDAVEDAPVMRAARMYKEGRLNEDTVSDALAMRDTEFVHAAIARLAKTSIPMVEKIFDMHAAKPIVSLCWLAGLPMRLALQLQQELGHVQAEELLYPKGGTDYPLTKDEMLWQLEFLGVESQHKLIR